MSEYVKTVAGMLPRSWRAALIKQVATVVRGGSPRPAGSPLYFNGDFLPWITVADVTIDNGMYLRITKSKLTEEGSKRTRITEPGTLMLTNSGATLGVPKISKIRAGANDGIAMLLDLKDLDIEFAYFYLSSKTSYFRDVVAPGVGQPNLNTDLIGDVAIPIPPKEEQQKIVHVLTTWNKAIAITEKLIANSQQQKKALIQQLLTGKKRFSEFHSEWRYKVINEISTRIQRKSDGQDHPILTISSLSGFVTQEERYSRYMAGESVKNYILLKEGEFAYNKGNSKTYQFGCIFDLDGFKTGLVPHVYVCFKLNEGLSHRYFKYLFEADYLKPQLGALVNTGVRNNGLLNIKPAEFLNTKVPVPCFQEQERIADALHAASGEIGAQQQKLAHLKQEKQALMQQLLTGKRRIKMATTDTDQQDATEVA